jgi:organic hydroperoxide reductase OsmC/OhrA
MAISMQVDIGKLEGKGFGLAVELRISLPDIDRSEAEKLVAEAHEVCPYSIVNCGNVDVKTILK